MTRLIKDWDELDGLENDKYLIKVEEEDRDCGWIVDKTTQECIHYLSTHTFYERTHLVYEKLLQQCGFDVKLESW